MINRNFHEFHRLCERNGLRSQSQKSQTSESIMSALLEAAEAATVPEKTVNLQTKASRIASEDILVDKVSTLKVTLLNR